VAQASEPRPARPARLAWGAFALWVLLVIARGAFAIAGTPADPFVIVMAGFPLAGIMILARQPRNRVGWILMAIGLLTAEPLGAYGSFALAHGLPGGALATVVNAPMWAPPIVTMGTILLLRFPNGTLLSPRWRWVERLSGASIGVIVVILVLIPKDLSDLGYPGVPNPIGIDELAGVLNAALVLVFLVPITIVLSATSLVIRFRRSSGVEREQLKWLTTAAGAVAALYLAGMVANVATGALWANSSPAWLDVLTSVSAFAFVLIPVAIGIAVLRYRLYEIDRIISRTLGYAILTAILAGVFAGAVLGLQALLRPITQESQAAVAASTLLVAALFGPIRRRVQAVVDRRFDRSRYDAARVADGFGARLRDRLELDAVSAELASTAHAALRPASVSVWVREPEERG
jgi:hypothetical protein